MKRMAAVVLAALLIASTGPAAKESFRLDGTRPFSMASAFTGVADDESAIYFNPAGLAGLEGNKIGLSGVYQNYGWSISYLTGEMEYSERGFSVSYAGHGLGFSFGLLGHGWWEELETRSVYMPDPSFIVRPVFYEYTFAAAYGREVTRELEIGAAFRLLHATDPYDDGDRQFFHDRFGAALDLGLLYAAPAGLSIGVHVENILSNGIDHVETDDFGMHAYLEELPVLLSVGLAYRPFDRLVIAVDARKLIEDEVPDALSRGDTRYTFKRSLHVGGEWRVVRGLFLRAGYYLNHRVSSRPTYPDWIYEYETYHNFTGGIGFRHKDLGIDLGVHHDDRSSKMETDYLHLNNNTLTGALSFSIVF